ncbi:RNA methyltransferase [Nocardia cyriacigeorgica]|uniref:RNA methyltransferase n=1 Tax=Nocardia cyriacigeorgica TaxID=135487 RepID=UPI0018960630|nr:RNA methyltransferase [Nocardia cyriacigeorgica]MBF6326538.1 RNA methyltransferase [Nocardia cyriacigeorgica]
MTKGFFGVAVLNPKTAANVGTLWRTAMSYQASLIATVGPRRYEYQSSDTCKTHNSMPLIAFRDIDDLIEHLPHGCQLVGVELSDRSRSLTGFRHPERALYLLGAEDHGIPDNVLARCHHVVQIPSPVAWSLNVSVAGALTIHDRWLKAGSPGEVAA